MQITDSQAAVLEWMLSDEMYWSPYKFAMTAYGWGEGDLAKYDGPRAWQRRHMEDMEAYLKECYRFNGEGGKWPDFYRHAVASGRGPGKSALVGMLSHWFMSTRIGGSVWVAANGEPQLRTKTFPEIGKWVSRGINRDFFDIQATSIQPAKWFRELIETPEEAGGLGKGTKYYYISGQLWSEENPDAFAGAHNADGEFAIFDEASGIPEKIWNVQAGVFTEDIPDRFWLAFSNPRKNSGAFYDCFHSDAELWRGTRVNAMEVEGINLSAFEMLIKKSGLDSDEVRVEVLGEFPKHGDEQFISTALVKEAQHRDIVTDYGEPLIMGIDVARYGDDATVCRFRRGRDARSMRAERWKGASLVESAERIMRLIDERRPDGVFIDQGMGSGVVDILRSRRYRCVEVAFGSKAENPEYMNKRVEMYARLRDWLPGAGIDASHELFIDLTAVEYNYQGDRLRLESKDDLKARIGRSPDDGDALALTFAGRVARSDMAGTKRRVSVAADIDYPIFG